jgi:hypothetical protein
MVSEKGPFTSTFGENGLNAATSGNSSSCKSSYGADLWISDKGEQFAQTTVGTLGICPCENFLVCIPFSTDSREVRTYIKERGFRKTLFPGQWLCKHRFADMHKPSPRCGFRAEMCLEEEQKRVRINQKAKNQVRKLQRTPGGTQNDAIYVIREKADHLKKR